MLITFHYIAIIIFQILRNRKRLKKDKTAVPSKDVDELDLENDLRFDPPVFRQRYSKVYETLINEKWRNNLKKLVDFGCAELSLFVYLKNLNIEDILFVDIDESLLREKLGKVEPLLADRLRRRTCPLEVSIFRGSVADPDYRLRKTDVITAIELIEHLYPDTLDAFPYNVFSFIRPKLVIITTPNADFNVMFGRLEGFRHPDHKFEWTREQFEDWAISITQRFPDYLVEFCGIGEGPDITKNRGCCSQAVIFTRKDMLNEKYISSASARSCQCDKSSPCKGQTIKCKLLCSCLCASCLPDFSVGVCTYLSCNINESDAYRPMKSEPKRSFSDTELDFKVHFSNVVFNNKITDVASDINPSYNIFYKLIHKVTYPYEVDSRSEKERLLDTFKYRIHTFSYVSSRFFVEEREQCEIPVRDLIYGDIEISPEEVQHLLSDAGYQIEKCVIQETGESEYCIISMPHEMEDISSSSEVTDGYSSNNSECNESSKFEANVESLSDWDEKAYVPKKKKSVSEQGGASSSLDPSTELKKPNSDPLFDSGYLKSPSPLESNPRLPQLGLQDNLESVETDQFEDLVAMPSLHSDDNKLHLKKTLAKEMFAGALVPMPDTQNARVDPNRINELDRFHNMSTVKPFMNSHLKPQNEFKKVPFRDFPVAGTSSSWKKSKKFKDKEKKVIEKKEFQEPTALDDAKSLTNCIIQNSLNKIEVDGEIVGPYSELIRDLSPLREPAELIEFIQEAHQNEPLHGLELQEAVPPPQVVENGDLANNNRDNEGNNLVENNIEEQDVDEGIDLLNDNLEELVPLFEDNVNVVENNNDLRVEVAPPIEEEQEAQAVLGEEENNDEQLVEESEDSIAQASREVLYDVNSEQDLLEDFDIPPQANHDNLFDMLNLSPNVVLLGIHPVSSSGIPRDQAPAAASIQTNTNSFPNWLLQILGTQVVPEEMPAANLSSHDEPHFYCQGDGLGVHPSVIAVEVDEAEDADNDTTSEESSSNNTADFAEVDPGPSEMFDMSSLPEESSPATSVMDENTLRAAGSIVWTDRRHNENDAFHRTSAEERQIVANGTSLVNEVISIAVDEVSRRSQVTLISHDLPIVETLTNAEQSPLMKHDFPSTSRSETFQGQYTYKPLGSDVTDEIKESESTYEQELLDRSNHFDAASDISDIHASDVDEHSIVFKTPESREVPEVESSSASDESEYFDPRTTEEL